MNMNILQPTTATILGTYKCTAACEDCCFESNPYITKRISLEKILEFIDDAIQLKSIELIVFSGGECFLLGQDLIEAISYAHKAGLRTRCVSNGYWAENKQIGYKRLNELKQAGLNELNISTGDFHQKWIPEQAVINATLLSFELNLDAICIMVETQKERKVTATNLLDKLKTNRNFNSESKKFKIIESPWMPMHQDRTIQQQSNLFANSDNIHTKTGCDSILQTIVLTPDSKLGLCCGLSREKIPELNQFWQKGSLEEQLDSAGKNFLNIWIFVEGPEKILAWAAKKEPKIDWQNKYAHRCHACLSIFNDPLVQQTIQKYYHERITPILWRYSLMKQKHNLLYEYI